MKFLNYDSPFMTGFRKGIDYVCLGLLWVIASVPVITFGAATTAMLQTAEFSIRREEGKVFLPFCKFFRKEFKQATVLWIIELPLLAVCVFNFLLVQQEQIHPVFTFLVCIASAVIFCWLQLWFGYQSRFEDSIQVLLVNTFRMTLGNLGRAVTMTVLTAVTMLIAYLAFIMVPPALFLIPGVYIMLYMPLLQKIIRKSIPQESIKQEELQEAE